MKAAACAKHFAVHSGPEGLRHEFDAQATAKDMVVNSLTAASVIASSVTSPLLYALSICR